MGINAEVFLHSQLKLIGGMLELLVSGALSSESRVSYSDPPSISYIGYVIWS